MPSQLHNKHLGKQAEHLAIRYLVNNNFTIKARNYRFEQGEIDAIAQKEDLLVFVEIKARTSTKFGYPESFVHATQRSLYQTSASEYVKEHSWQGNIRFDIISLYKANGKWRLAHFEDAFY